MSAAVLLAALVLSAGPLDFDTDVLPVLSKAGCNAAACHGAAAGRGGFKLSLFAGDPAADHEAIVRELEGRRINLARPESSLLLAKPTEELDHGGGKRLEPRGDDARLLAAWIAMGAPRPKLRRLTKLAVTPREALVSQAPGDVQLRVVALFDDDLKRDVTASAVYLSSDPAAVEAGASGRLTVRRTGRHTVVIRYLHLVDTVQLTVPLGDAAFDLTRSPRASFIDDEVLATLAELRIPPALRADDATLLRRVTLDLTGRLPAPDDVRAYLKNADPRKYESLVERLLASPEFVEFWTFTLGKTLRIGAPGQDPAGSAAYQGWLRKHLEAGTPLDKMAAELITAEGDSHMVGAANFHRVAGDARTEAEYVTESLLGVRLRCANCHNHPLDRWTQDDYHGLAAVFARIDRGRNVRLMARGDVTHPRTGEPALPRLPGERFVAPEENGRAALSAWLTARENPYFAKAAVNRLWKSLLGRGLVEPADDLRATNPATHPPLLARLAADFLEHECDIRHTLRLVATSETYARGAEAPAERHSGRYLQTGDGYYSHALPRPLEAEVLADALADVTGVPNLYGSDPKPARAVSLVGPQVESAALDILGRCRRDDTCAGSDSSQRNLATRLHLINGELINGKLASAESRLAASLAAGNDNAAIIEDSYLRALGRQPLAAERDFWLAQLDFGKDQGRRRQLLQDFLWSLLNCQEFTTNH